MWKASERDIPAIRSHFSLIAQEREGVVHSVRHHPGFCVRIREEAVLAIQDLVRLPGNPQRSCIGNPPLWLERRYNDNEYLWQMNRMNHWSWMCWQYALEGEEQYAQKVCSELLDWCRKVGLNESLETKPLEYFSACNPMRALELGIRLYKTWPMVADYLSQSPSFTDEVLVRYAESIHLQASLLRKVSPQLWPEADHNHFVMEMLGLLTTALYFPVFPESEEWKAYAIHALERAARAQLTDDGGQVEGCPSYHDGCMYWFGIPLVFEKRFGIRMSDEYQNRYKKSLLYSLYAMRPNGKCVPVGDSHAGVRSVISGLYDLVAFGDDSLLRALNVFISKKEVDEVVEEFVWWLCDTDRVMNTISHLSPHQPSLPLWFWNRTLSQAVLKSSWNKDALSVLMICHTPVKNAHAHIDANSFDFTAYGKTIIVDPGYYCYREQSERHLFKSTAYHSTLVIDGQDQFPYVRSFAFGPQKEGRITNVVDEGWYQQITGVHRNYEPVIHIRHLFLVEKSFLVVVDEVQGAENNLVSRIFHFDYPSLSLADGKVVARADTVSCVCVSFPKAEVRTIESHASDFVDLMRPTTRLVFENRCEGEGIYVTVLCPYREQEPAVSIDHSLITVGKKHYRLVLDDKGCRLGR